MTAARRAIDPLWQCLCPAWTSPVAAPAPRLLVRSKRPVLRCLNTPAPIRYKSNAIAEYYASKVRDNGKLDAILSPLADSPPPQKAPPPKIRKKREPDPINYQQESTDSLYSRLRAWAIDGRVQGCQEIAEVLVRERDEKPDLAIYNALILSNAHPIHGSAARVADLLDDMTRDKLEPDVRTCHVALKVLSVHVDHLLRTEILDFMNKRWISLTETGAHDVAAGLLREGLFEQALERMDNIRREGLQIRAWLLDMTVYVLCEANEISEAYRIMRARFDAGEPNLGRSLWSFFLDKASSARHHAATALVWSNQVTQQYINPSSGVCLNVLATAAQAADAVMATEVFTHLTQRGTPFEPIHYELLVSTYLTSDPPDLRRAMTVLTIMARDKFEPTALETRPLYQYLRDKPELLPEALDVLRDLHSQDRQIPIAALNVLIECYGERGNLSEALKVYKLIHTFVPVSEGAKKTFANIETFNLLLKACRVVDPPDAQQASFLISEMQALQIKPTPLAYDRLILVFILAAQTALKESHSASDSHTQLTKREEGVELIDSAFRHFTDMQSFHWFPRFGTLEMLSRELAHVNDPRCWDVLQAGEDGANEIEGWRKKGGFARRNVEEAWRRGADELAAESTSVEQRKSERVSHVA